MAKITDGTTTITTYHGLQLSQYVAQLRKAGFLKPLMIAKGMQRRRLEVAGNTLIRDLRSGRVNQATKDNAAQLGLRIYPNTK